MQVPLQTTPGAELAAGSEVQFSATGIEPVKDVVTDDIQRLSKAQTGLGATIQKIDNELNDAEGKRLANEYYGEAERINNEYSLLKGVNAVGTVEVDGEQITVFDQYQGELKKAYNSFLEKAGNNSTVRSVFRDKAAIITKDGINNMTKHSLKQQRDYLENETDKEIEISKNAAKTHFESWNDPNGEFRKNYAIVLARLQELAVIKGWNIDPNAIDPTDPEGKRKLGISNQYLAEVEKYNMEITKAVIKSLQEKNDYRGVDDFLDWIDPDRNSKELNKFRKGNKTEAEEHSNSKCVDAMISNNGNQNDGNFISQSDALSCLSSNNTHNNGIGGSVIDGENSNEVDTADKTQSENINSLDQRRSTSKFFSSESSLKGTLIPEHQTTHLFAIQKLDVKTADSLYTKAKSSIEYDKEKFKTDPEYATEINKQIIGKYNELIIEASKEKYKNKEIVKLEKQIEDARSQKGTGKTFQKNKRDKIDKLEAALDKARADDPKYVDKIESDLKIITNNIDYDFGSEESTIEIDSKTGLQPLEVLKANLKKTIKDPKALKVALKDLEFKYNKIKTQREAVYNQAFEQAQEIAFNTEGNGWNDLKANGIDINDFTEKDREILKNGPPEESDTATLVKLEKDPNELINNLNAYRPKLSATQFLKLKQYSESLKADPGSVLAVTIDNDMLDLTLNKFDFGFIKDGKFDDNDYLEIKGRWKQLIDEEQTRTKGKLTRERKQELLNGILTNTVIYDYGVLKGDHRWPSAIINKDQLKNTYVKVGGETIWLKDIPAFQREKIIKKIRAKGLQVTEQLIADMWVFGGKSKISNDFDWEKYNLEKGNTSTSSLK